jgi:hypothetical protein
MMSKRKLKTYNVVCAVTRTELYRVKAESEAKAKEIAFGYGELVGVSKYHIEWRIEEEANAQLIAAACGSKNFP